MPLIPGTHRIFPDLAAVPWSRFDADSNQDLIQVFGLGVGNPQISNLRIGDTPLGQFKGVSHHILRGRAGPERADIHTEAGAALENTDWHTRRTAQNSTHIGIDMTATLTDFDSKGQGRSSTAMVRIELQPLDTTLGIIQIYRRSLTGDDRGSQIRRSFVIPLYRPGTWDVRIRRAAPPSDHSRHIDRIEWHALRSIRPGPGDYRGQTRLWARIRASGQLSGTFDRASCMARQPVPVADGEGGWTVQPSSNPAWIFLPAGWIP